MSSAEDLRFQAHVLLVELDAATTQLMMLVVAGELSGPSWDDAFARHSSAYSAWLTAVRGVKVDPMPILDRRPPEGPLNS